MVEDRWLRSAPLARDVWSLSPSPTSAPSRPIEPAPCVNTPDPDPAGSPSCKDRAGRQTQRSVHHVPGHSPAGGLNLGRAPLLIKRALEPLVPRNVIGDRFFCWLAFLKNHRRIPKTSDPIYFSDHLFKIRSSGELYDPLRQITSDKILVKAYVAHFLGEGFTPATLGILASEMEVDTFKFPRPCVIKPSHASQLIRILKDENDVLDRGELKHWLRFDYYRFGRESNYRYVKHRIIVEELLCESDGSLPNDFKLFCFNGEPQFIQVDAGRFTNHTRNFYSTEWDLLPVTFRYANHPVDSKPKKIQDMLEVARTLARPFFFVRVDLYLIGERIYVGELTHIPENGRGAFVPRHLDSALSSLFAGRMLKDLDLSGAPGKLG